MSFLDQLKAAWAAGEPASVAGAIPYARFLGITLGLVDGELRATMCFAEHLVGNPAVPALHGGAIASLLEITAIAQVLWEQDMEAAVIPRPVTLTFDYLRPGRPADLFASARIVRKGRRVCTVHATCWQDDAGRPVATANVTLLLG